MSRIVFFAAIMTAGAAAAEDAPAAACVTRGSAIGTGQIAPDQIDAAELAVDSGDALACASVLPSEA